MFPIRLCREYQQEDGMGLSAPLGFSWLIDNDELVWEKQVMHRLAYCAGL
jgi:hypothetical protein